MSWTTATARWFKSLVVPEAPSPKSAAGKRSIATGAAAALATEVLASERVCRAAASTETLAATERRAGPNAFGQLVTETVSEDPTGAVATAEGRALGGARVTALVPEGRIGDCHGILHRAASRRAPLVVHAVVSEDTASAATLGTDGHGPYHALADTGVILCMARNAQRAVDMALVARRASECALLPAVVVQEGPDTAWAPASVELPTEALVRALLGAPDDVIGAPSAAQSMLLGERRRRVPRFFDLARPAAHGMQLSGQDLAVSLAGQREFFGRDASQHLVEAMDHLQQLTGRKLELVSTYRLDDAKFAFVVQGVAIDAAMAVAAHLRKERGAKVGVLGIEWLRPLATDEIRRALAGVQTITVLERTGDAWSPDGPLTRELRAALGPDAPRLLTATFGLGGQPLSNADLLGAFENMKLGRDARVSLALGVAFPKARTDHPRRDVLNQKVRSAYPELAESTLAIDTPLDLRPDTARTVGLWARKSESPERVLETLAAKCAAAVGEHVWSRTASGEQGTWMAQVSACPEPSTDPASVVAHDVAIVAAPELPHDINPLRHLLPGASALIASALPPETLWHDLPSSWRREVRARDLTLWVLSAPVAELVEHVAWLLAKGDCVETASGKPRKLDWKSFPEHAEPEASAGPPLAVRRFSQSRSTYDNLPRFWGEVAEPRIEAGAAEPAPDPYLSLGAVPPSTSALFHVAIHQNRMPQIDAERCVGCGACWSACPDSALAPSIIRTEALLNAAAEIAREPGIERSPAAAKLERAHKQLGARVDGTLAKQKSRRLTPEILRDSFGWLIEQMKIVDDERPSFESAFEATLNALQPLPFAVTDAFFHEPHASQKGSGELLGIALSPAACQACGGCAAVCGEEAIQIVGRSEVAVARARAGFGIWERLPDPSGESLAHAAGLSAVGKLPAVLGSRHTMLSVTGGGGHEPGSGARLGARLTVAVTEYRQQRAMVAELGKLDRLLDQLHQAVRQTLGAAVPTDDLAALERALVQSPGRASSMTALLTRLEQEGERATVDADRARRLVRTTKLLGELRHEIAEGPAGLGRARFGLVVASPSLAEWAAEFPRNPFAVPVVVDLSAGALELALGLAAGLADRQVDAARLVRTAELLLEGPADLVLKERELEQLTFAALEPRERAHAAPLLVLCGPEALFAESRAGLTRLLASDLPIKVIVLDGQERLLRSGSTLLPFIADRRAFVLSTTVAHRDHLFDGVHEALESPGPALVHLYSPRPGRHGFDSAHTILRAHAAVNCRVHPLLRWDPAAEGVFGAKLSLDGNPAPGEPWARDDHGGELTPAHFASAEARFAHCFADAVGPSLPVPKWALGDDAERRGGTPVLTIGDTERALSADLARAVVERLETWRTLQELSGLSTPFTQAVRAAAEHDIHAQHQGELARLRSELEQKLAENTELQTRDATARLGARLIELAGYGASARGSGGKPT